MENTDIFKNEELFNEWLDDRHQDYINRGGDKVFDHDGEDFEDTMFALRNLPEREF